MGVAVHIPAYNPDARLVEFVRELRRAEQLDEIIVVDDGSHSACRSIFSSLAAMQGVKVLRHAANLGKGAALKTGFNYVCCALRDCVGVVTADADGQHLAADVLRVADRLQKQPDSLVVGARRFTDNIPLRSKLGNVLTRYVFWGLIGERLADTQSGLRGVPRWFAGQLLCRKYNGYEFELDMLIQCKQRRVSIAEEPITTVYLDGNRSSHFNPFLDSLKIYWVLLRFLAASIATAAVDYFVFVLVYLASANILLSQASARLVAAFVNYALARHLVFHSRGGVVKTLSKFLVLVGVMGAASYAILQATMLAFGWNVIVAKLASEMILYIANFAIQRDCIFAEAPTRKVAEKSQASAAPETFRRAA